MSNPGEYNLIAELDAKLIRYDKREDGTYYVMVDTLAEADGVQFLCPKCYHMNNGEVGTHSCICWFVGHVPDDVTPGPGRWNPQGTSLHDLTFVGPGAFSVQLTSGCGWHGYVRDGYVTLS